jgi:hypothetical protein
LLGEKISKLRSCGDIKKFDEATLDIIAAHCYHKVNMLGPGTMRRTLSHCNGRGVVHMKERGIRKWEFQITTQNPHILTVLDTGRCSKVLSFT